MRSREFITEKNANGKLGPRRQQSTRGLHKFRGTKGNTTYVLNRVMMAVATTDGKTMPDIDSESWIGTSALAAPYSAEEHEMLKMAYQAVGANSADLNHGDLDSEELNSTNKQSPVQAFKGY
jgi:hypothetical protein